MKLKDIFKKILIWMIAALFIWMLIFAYGMMILRPLGVSDPEIHGITAIITVLTTASSFLTVSYYKKIRESNKDHE